MSTTRQADSVVAPPGDDHTVRPFPMAHITPNGRGSSSGSASSSGSGSTTPTAWQPLVNQSQDFGAGHALLLTDGSVMVQAVYNDVGWDLNSWWKLTPDQNGSYVNGTWTQLASLPNGYAPMYYGSAVLPDGRVIIQGGEYQVIDGSPQEVWQNNGAIYDPVEDTWTAVAPPAGWSFIGDAVSTVLADGRFLLSDDWSQTAIFNPASLTWTTYATTGKADPYNEEGWTLLPNGQLLTVDANVPGIPGNFPFNVANLQNTELLNPSTGTWKSAGNTPVELEDANADESGSFEMGPQVLRPDGTVFAAGATGHSAVYDPSCGKWTQGPDFPNVAGEGQYDVADGPAALAPNGHVLVVASPGVFNNPAHVFEFDGKSLTQLADPDAAPFGDSSYRANLLLLPTGEIMYTNWWNDVEIYPAPARLSRKDAPRIADGCELSNLQPGQTYRLDGKGLNGVSQAVAYGDDSQQATNYPLVRITNRTTKHVFYARTHDHSSMGVDRNATSHTFFDVPAGIETGLSDLVVVANGIASDPVSVEIRPSR